MANCPNCASPLILVAATEWEPVDACAREEPISEAEQDAIEGFGRQPSDEVRARVCPVCLTLTEVEVLK